MITHVVNERTTPTYTDTLVDAAGDAVAGSSLDSIKLTLYDEASEDVINNRDGESDVLGGDVTVNSDGELSWTMEELDNVILNTALAEERHIALFEIRWTVSSVEHVIREPVCFIVKNLSKVP
jgi:hypothetical protein